MHLHEQDSYMTASQCQYRGSKLARVHKVKDAAEFKGMLLMTEYNSINHPDSLNTQRDLAKCMQAISPPPLDRLPLTLYLTALPPPPRLPPIPSLTSHPSLTYHVP
jgi:hypothetical protein